MASKKKRNNVGEEKTTTTTPSSTTATPTIVKPVVQSVTSPTPVTTTSTTTKTTASSSSSEKKKKEVVVPAVVSSSKPKEVVAEVVKPTTTSSKQSKTTTTTTNSNTTTTATTKPTTTTKTTATQLPSKTTKEEKTNAGKQKQTSNVDVALTTTPSTATATPSVSGKKNKKKSSASPNVVTATETVPSTTTKVTSSPPSATTSSKKQVETTKTTTPVATATATTKNTSEQLPKVESTLSATSSTITATPSSSGAETTKKPHVSAYNPGKEDNSISAILCRIYFAVGLLICWSICFVFVLPMYLLHLAFGFDKNKSLMGYLFRLSNRCVVETNPFWKIRTFYANSSTKAKLPKKQKKVIFICNHQSFMDPFVIISSLPIEAKWVAKHILFSIPFGGWLMRIVGDVPIVFKSKKAENTVTDKDSVTMAMSRLKGYLNNDASVFFFPEGRRSDDPNKFLDFRKGAFVMSLETGADIIPLAIHGSHTMWEVKHKLPRPGHSAVVMGDPISVKGLTLEKDVDFLLEKTRSAIEKLHVQAKKKFKSMK